MLLLNFGEPPAHVACTALATRVVQATCFFGCCRTCCAGGGRSCGWNSRRRYSKGKFHRLVVRDACVAIEGDARDRRHGQKVRVLTRMFVLDSHLVNRKIVHRRVLAAIPIRPVNVVSAAPVKLYRITYHNGKCFVGRDVSAQVLHPRHIICGTAKSSRRGGQCGGQCGG